METQAYYLVARVMNTTEYQSQHINYHGIVTWLKSDTYWCNIMPEMSLICGLLLWMGEGWGLLKLWAPSQYKDRLSQVETVLSLTWESLYW